MIEITDSVLRHVLTISSSILILFASYVALSFLWQKSDPDSFAVRPFVIVDPAGRMASGEAGLARMLISRVNELQGQLEASNTILTVVQRDDSANPYAGSAEVFSRPRREPWRSFRLESGWIQPNMLELEFQGIDLGGVLNWISRSVRPPQKSLTFTLSVHGDKFGAAGDISDLGIEGTSTIWIEPHLNSVHDVIDQLAIQLVKLRVSEKNEWMQGLDSEQFSALIRTIPQIEQKREAYYAASVRNTHFQGIYDILSSTLNRFDGLPGLTLVTAEAARMSGNFEAAVLHLESVQTSQLILPPDQQNLALLENIEVALREVRSARNARSSLTAASLTIESTQAGAAFVRSNIIDLNEESQRKFRNQFKAIKNASDAEIFADLASLYVPYAIHQDPKFLAWNRAFLLHFERTVRSTDPSFHLVCWDASVGGDIPDLFTSNPDQNALYAPGRNEASAWAEYQAQLHTNLLAIVDWDLFSQALENRMSNLVHVGVGGQMALVESAAYDPIFYAHRCNVDRIWATWQVLHNWPASDNTLDDSFLKERLEPFDVTVAEMMDIELLGYKYQN